MSFLSLLKRPKRERRQILANQTEILDRLGRLETLLGDQMRQLQLPAPVYVGDGTVLAETFFGSKIYVDGHDASVAPHIIRDGQWEPWLADFIMRELKPGQTFVDIGANCGFYALLAAHIVGQSGTVVAIEPQGRLAKLIRRSLFVNGFDSFAHCLPMAIGQVAATANLDKSDFLAGSASIAGVGKFHDSSEAVTVKPLADALSEAGEFENLNREIRPDVIKIDSEGYEWYIWQGASDFFASCDKLLICLEFSPMRYAVLGDNPAEFLDRILADGFSISVVGPDSREKQLDSAQIADLAKVEYGHADLVLRKG